MAELTETIAADDPNEPGVESAFPIVPFMFTL